MRMGWRAMGAAMIIPLAAVMSIYVAATPAEAAVSLGRITSFGSLSSPNDIAVDQANGVIFVASISTDSVVLYVHKGADEYEQIGELIGAETPEYAGRPGPSGRAFAFAQHEPAPVAVDSSNGDVYIGDIGHHVVDRFVLKGPNEYRYECQFTGFKAGCHPNMSVSGEEGTPEPHFGETAGVAVDSQGDLFVADFNNDMVDEFNAHGEDVGQIAGPVGPPPANLAIDATDDLYISQFEGPLEKVKINPATAEVESELRLYGGETRAVGVDSATGEVYADNVSQVARFGLLEEALSPATFPGMASEGVAVNESTHEIYISDRGHEDVEVFGPVVVPDATTGLATGVGKIVAKVSGIVNPDGAGEAHYFFRYGKGSGFEEEHHTTEQSAGSGSSGERVEAALTELRPATTYDYQLVASNANGINEFSEVETFTTSPAVTLEPCRVPHPPQALSATLCVMINPEGLETTYHFTVREVPEMVTPPFEAPEFSFPTTGAGSQPEELTVPIAGLRPTTTYEYKVVAENMLDPGSPTESSEQMLTTPPAVPTVDVDEESKLEPQLSFATGIGPHEAVLHGTINPGMINPGQGLTSYYFVYGPTATYGSSTVEAYTQLNYEDDSVEQLVTGLPAGSVVHYALVAINASGTTVGPDEQLTTTAASVEPAPPEGGGGPPLGVTPSPALVQPSTPALLPTPPFPAIRPVKAPSIRRLKCRKGLIETRGRCVRQKSAGGRQRHTARGKERRR